MRMLAALALTIVVAVALVSSPVHASATPHMIFAPVDVGHGQIARLNITNISNSDLLDSGLPAGPCVVAYGFVDGNNQALVPAVRVSLGGSRSAHLDVSFDAAEPRRVPGVQGNRGSTPARAYVGFPSAAEGSCASIVGSVEIVDGATGATQAIQSPLVYVGFNPQPDIPGLVGVPSGQ